MSKVYVGDIGTKLLLDSGSDISTATVKRIYYRKPDGTGGYWTATIEDTTKLYYLLQIDELDQAGRWSFQVYVETPSWSGHGEEFGLTVYDVI